MPLIAASSGIRPSALGRRGVAALVGLGVAGALSIATMSNPWLAREVGDRVSESIQGMKTVAAMLAERSPGQRPQGALAQLKHKRQAALHQRALPKIRPAFPAYEALAASPPSPPFAPPVQPAPFATLAGGPGPIVPPTGGGGGPPGLSNLPLPGGGGGGGSFTPVPQVTPQVPPVPVPVPEPSTWAMMILGFAMIGRMMGRKTVARPSPALE